MVSKLDQLRTMSVVVADTGDLDAIARLKPFDCTTNPSLVLRAASSPRYSGLIASAMDEVLRHSSDQEFAVGLAARQLAVRVGADIAGLVPGRISTEIDPRMSFDVDAMVAEGTAIISDYAALGIGPERVLVKIAATWEGIRAAEALQRAGIDTNMTLVFGLDQALACAGAGAFLVSPFVGRIADWHRQTLNATFGIKDHPGLAVVRSIHDAFRRHGLSTAVMAASFRSVEEVEALAGCDRLTVSPSLLEALSRDHGTLVRRMDDAPSPFEPLRPLSEADFRWRLNGDPMVTAKLAEGIRLFAADLSQLHVMLKTGIESSHASHQERSAPVMASRGAGL